MRETGTTNSWLLVMCLGIALVMTGVNALWISPDSRVGTTQPEELLGYGSIAR